jgi:serine phosphatase RsbU (regulator of sigma subunit)
MNSRSQNQKMVLYVGLSLVLIFSIILINRFRIIRNQKSLIEVKEKETQAQKHVIEEKQKEILDSINYAKRIQYTLLAHDQFLNDNIPDHFVYFNPKDIVSGDFYWATKVDSKFYLATCDSTGHGIPGAFMSLLNIGFLSEAINEKDITSPDKVFDYVRMKLTGTISRDGQKDGFDGILVCFDQATKQITYAAANNAPVLINNGSFIELPADRMPVGLGERKENFSLFTIEAKPGDVLYLYTDGYADQFGGPKGKKFKYKQLNELLVEIHSKSSSEQQEALKHTFDEWKGNLEQVDDVCVIGIRIS